MSGHRSFDELHVEQMKDPEYAKAFEDAKAHLHAAREVPCRYGNCIWYVWDDTTLETSGDDGVGPVACPCKADENDYALSEYVREMLKEAYEAGEARALEYGIKGREPKRFLSQRMKRFDAVMKRRAAQESS